MTTHEPKQRKGIIELICGPMFSGKTTEFLRRLRRKSFANQKVLIFKPSLDTRGEQNKVMSHDGEEMPSFVITKPSQILDYIQKEDIKDHCRLVVGIDEVQFFDPSVMQVILAVSEQGINLIIDGLDKDFKGDAFQNTDKLLVEADYVTKLQAVCAICGRDASFSQRLINGEPAKKDDPIVLIGAQDSYQPRCRTCWIRPQ